jgi:DNA-binding transcriptional MerR regulator
LLIGDVTALTGISAGRIRHYESLGLLAPAHLESGYRTFSPEDVLLLLRIDLLRSLGMSLNEIRDAVGDEPGNLRQALEQHRAVLDAERRRIEHLLAAVDRALAGTGGGSAAESNGRVADGTKAALEDEQALMARLATTHRDSLGLLGRLTRPLSPEATAVFARVLGPWDLPVPPLFGQMVLPEPISDLLERLAAAADLKDLFARLYQLAQQVMALPHDDEGAAERLAATWVTEQLTTPLPPAVTKVLAETVPSLADLPVVRHGFLAWAESLSPVAGKFMIEVETLAAQHNAHVLGVIVVPA